MSIVSNITTTGAAFTATAAPGTLAPSTGPAITLPIAAVPDGASVPRVAAPYTVPSYEVTKAVTAAGSHFFDRDTMRFFRSRIASTGWFVPDGSEGRGGWFVLVTSEQFEGVDGWRGDRRHSVRCWHISDHGRQFRDHHGEFQEHPNGAKAARAARRLVAGLHFGTVTQ